MMFADKLVSMLACDEAVKWVGCRPAEQAWVECQRGDWMLWLAGKMSGPPESEGRKKIVLAACECARLALRHIPAGEERPRLAIETAERWARGEGSTVDDVRLARRPADAAASAASASSSSAAAYAAYAAAAAAYAAADGDAAAAAYASAYASAAYAAAYAANAAASAAAYAAYASSSSSSASAAAAAYSARTATLAECATIVRKYYPLCPTKE